MNRKVVLGAVASLLALTSSAPAGIVFLKNGYILQAPVHDRGEDSVVLRYPTGKVTVESRFIKHVVLDPAEEAMIEKRRRDGEKAAPVRAPRLEREVVLSELPANLDALVLDKNPVPVSENSAPVVTVNPVVTDSSTDPQEVTTTDPATEVVTLQPLPNDEPEGFDTFDPVDFEALGVHGERPTDWAFDNDSNRVVMRAPNRGPAVTIDRFDAAFRVTDASSVVMTLLDEEFDQVDVMLTETVDFAGQTAIRVLGASPLNGTQFKSWFVVSKDASYWISAQWSAQVTDGDRALIERITSSMTFVD